MQPSATLSKAWGGEGGASSFSTLDRNLLAVNSAAELKMRGLGLVSSQPVPAESPLPFSLGHLC